VPYTGSHVLTQLQLLLFSALAFSVLMRTGIYPPELRLVNLDTDWTYRRFLPALIAALARGTTAAWSEVRMLAARPWNGAMRWLARHHGVESVLARTWSTGTMAFWAAVMLAAYLSAVYLP
jgi:multicomponent Na+:H+ antiporter subunit D